MQLVDGEYTHLFCDDVDAVWRQTVSPKRCLRRWMDWIGLYCFPCNMMKFGLCVCASVLLILSPVSQFGREVKKCLLRIWSKRKRKWKFRTKNTTSQCCDIDKTLYVVNLEKINYQCDCPVTVLFYSICDISKFAKKLAAFFVSTSSESLSKLRILT